MKIYALDSETQDYQYLINLLAEKVSIDLFDDFDELIEQMDEECEIILLDFDVEQRKKNKMIAKAKKAFPDMNIFLLANTLDAKKMAKHQKSKTGANIYFQTPVDSDLLNSLLEPFLGEEFEDTLLDEEQVLKDHDSTSEISSGASDVSQSIDGVFSSTFFDEYAQEESTSDTSTGLEDIKLDQGSDEAQDSVQEISLGDDSEEISLDEESSEEISLDDESIDEISMLDDSSEIDEISLSEEGPEGEFSLDDSAAEEVALTEDANWQEEEGLSLGSSESEDEEQDTLFPDEDDLSFPEIDVTEIQTESAGATSEPIAQESQSPGEISLSMDDDGAELSLGEISEVTTAPDELNELSFNGEEDNELKISDETSPSQVMDLEETKGDIGLVEETKSQIHLSSEHEEASSGDMNTSVTLIADLDQDISNALDEQESLSESNELTSPAISSEVDELKVNSENEELLQVNMPESQFDDSDQDSISDLLSASESYQENLGSSEDVNTGVTIVGSLIDDEQEEDQEEIEEVRINTQTSIDLEDASLSSINLPDEVPDFSTTVAKKLDEIDDMLAEENSENIAAGVDEGTLVAATPHQETNIYRTQGISDEDATVIQPISSAGEGAQNTTNVPEDLKEQHREYVQTHDEELIRLGETIKSLREDREHLLDRLLEFENKKDNHERELLDYKAQVDEKNIELVVVKKRLDKQIDDLRFQLDVISDKKELLSKQNENSLKELETLRRQKSFDVNKVRARERELEEKLEMLRQDAEIQIRNRDQKILELKRRIDTLEFDIESSHLKEKKSTDQQIDLEDKMNRVIQTLRGAIGQLEDDQGLNDRQANIKKNLDI